MDSGTNGVLFPSVPGCIDIETIPNDSTVPARTVDLRSDTVTKPTAAMCAAMANAEVDDDLLGVDPTAFKLQQQMAKIFAKEAGLFVPSGTMGNLIAILVHCEVCLLGHLGNRSFWLLVNNAGSLFL